ncbi:MAG TPA: Ig-like domain-containing protein, partial [Gammaproteobacteria bacterium]
MAPLQVNASTNLSDNAYAVHVPVGFDQHSMSVLGFAADRFAGTRGPQQLVNLATFSITQDQTPPVLNVTSPVTGANMVPMQRILLHLHATDNTGGVRSIQLLDGSGKIVKEIGGLYGQQDFVIPYDVPRDLTSGELDLGIVALDDTGATSTRTLSYPVGPNAPPQITLTGFSTYKLNGVYKNVISDADRLNYGEFWVRSGEPFRLDTQLDDDAGLAAYTINRIDDAGNRIVEYSQTFHSDCPDPQILKSPAGAEIVFKQAEDTQYEIVLTDTYGNKTVRNFLVHPLSNMAPEVHITSPADQQAIVAGTFQIKVGIVATDDRQLDSNAITVYANGVPLSMINPDAVLRGTNDIGGAGAIQQGFNSMYDDIEKTYGVDMANSYGRPDSPYAEQEGFILAVPAGLVRYGEPLKLTAVVHDADGSVGRHEITINVDQDTINPEVAVTRPGPGFGPTEAADFTLGFEGYDNVKVSKLEVFTAYGVMTSDGNYVTTPYGNPIRTVDSIDARDFNPVTTLNIDTPEYLQTVHVDKLTTIMSRFTGLNLTGNEPYDIWVKLVAYDATGNSSEREVSFPVHVDQRPTMDFVTPTQGAKVVEGTPLEVNLKAFDDVGVDSVRLIATHGSNNEQVFNLALKQPPYSFQVTTPTFDSSNSANNLLTLSGEAIDTYGASYGDLDKHTADDTLTLQIVQDQPPSVLIGQPKDGTDVIEGEHVLVQINANDDVGIDRVVLQVAGLTGGDRVFTDTSYPYEFLVDVPYGQAGKDLTLTSSAVEKRYSGTPRVATTPSPLHLHVQRDTQPPELTVTEPAASGTTVVEKRSLPFAVEATDNVAVSSVGFVLSADLNGDGQFTPDEVIAQQTLLTAPYAGSIAMKALSDYLGDKADGVNQLNMQLTVHARDGAGNESVVTRPVTLVRNQPPSVDGIQILDSQGYSLGSSVSQITEGREIVVQVLAHDPEVGVDSVRLVQATNPKSVDDYKSVGTDNAAPFQFHLTVPQGSAGSVLSFEAQATDVDGYVSKISAPLDLTVVPDQPPTAKIVKPDNDQSVIIQGQDLDVWVQADDDLGPSGIDRVVFSVNGTPVSTVYDSYSKQTGSAAQEDIYRAVITPPEGSSGFVVQATAYDVAGHATRTQEVHIGTVADTVAPKVSELDPLQGDILTAGATVHAVVSINDIGADANRQVYLHWIREYQDDAGAWHTIATADQQLLRDDTRNPGDTTPVSDPDNNYYIYWGDFADGHILMRGTQQNERVRVVAEVKTPNHDVTSETTHEVGLPVSEKRFLLPAKPGAASPSAGERTVAQSVYYTAVSQFQSDTQTGALLGAWSNVDPMRLEQGLGVALENDTSNGAAADHPQPRTGLFIADDTNDAYTNGVEHYVYSDLLAGSSEVFSGTISEIAADANFVLASKSGVLPGTQLDSGGGAFADTLIDQINKDTSSGKTYLDDDGGELLIFTVHNGDNQFGLPYLLKGRIDLPYPDVYGVARKDNLAFVANGYGGVQVIDISNLAAPYRVGFIKPDDLARDVKIKDNFAYIAASHQGLVIADITQPSMPIVAKLDTLGIANRLTIAGSNVYVTDMAEDGSGAELDIISIADPYHPKLLHSITLNPARPDLTAGGVYDVAVAGDKAYVTEHDRDQTGKPAQSLVQVIDLAALDTPNVDATVPVVIHRQATATDFAARGLAIARGALQVAAGMLGIDRIDMPDLTIIGQTPARDARNVSTELPDIQIELSSVLSSSTDLSQYLRVVQGDPLIGADVTSKFTLGFAQRAGQPAYRFIQLTRIDGQTLDPNTTYYIIIKKGLAPLTGGPLGEDYVAAFSTSKAGAALAPVINSVTPNSGSIEGGTPIVVRGTNFGNSPQLFVGGQQLVVDKVEAPSAVDPFEKIEAHTLPNYPGPAAVTVVNDAGLQTTGMGLYTYLDELKISFIDPPIVHVSQAGVGDQVRIVGYGFSNSVTLRAYESGDPGTAIVDTVDQDRLKLVSAEEMHWVVPDFGGNYRGYVDVEISDASGRHYLLPHALFYGRLTVDRTLEAEQPLSLGDLEALWNQQKTYVPDALKLPPGTIVDTASDPNLGLVYVLGKGILAKGVSPDSVNTLSDFDATFAPGWISLVHYDRHDLADAAPLYGFGYFNLPQALTPSTMTLTSKQLYVAASGYHFPLIDPPYEDQNVILVYDRENHLPGAGDPPGQNRDILYSLPLNFSDVPTSMVTIGDLLFAANDKDGVAVISIADPSKPSVIRVLSDGNAAGESLPLAATRLEVVNGHLNVVGKHGRFVFDVTRPTIPQIGFDANNSISAPTVDGMRLAAQASGTDLALFDATHADHLQQLSVYDDLGLPLPGSPVDLSALNTLASEAKLGVSSSDQNVLTYTGYLNLFDTSDSSQITLLDAAILYSNHAFDSDTPETLGPVKFSTDGIVIAAEKGKETVGPGAGIYASRLMLMDTLTPDLIASDPSNGQTYVPRNAVIALTFSTPVDIPLLQTASGYLSKYVSLVYA